MRIIYQHVIFTSLEHENLQINIVRGTAAAAVVTRERNIIIIVIVYFEDLCAAADII